MSILKSHGLELHALLVRLTLRRDVAGELFQELFIKLADSQGFGRAAEPWAYVRRCAINLAFDWRRRQARGRADDSVAVDAVDPSPPPWLRLAQREQVEQILALAIDLPAMTREAFVLRYVHDQDYDEIGRALGRTSHQSRALCHFAIQEIRRRLGPARGADAPGMKIEVFHE